MAFKLTTTNASGVTDLTQLVQSVTWSGDYKQCARTLDFGLLQPPGDKNIPVVPCDLGQGISFCGSSGELFNGHIWTRTRNTESSLIDIAAYDRGVYVKRNKKSYNFTQMMPEEITKRLCADFKIKVGNIAATGVKLNRRFIAATLYQIIQTAYTLASRETEEQYQTRFEGDSLSVVKKGVNSETVVISAGVNLMSASVTETLDELVNQVQVVDSDGGVVDTVKNQGLIDLYGLLQEQIKKVDGKDARKEAQKLLDDNGVSQKVTVNNLGDERCTTGNAVVIQEPYTGLYGLFYIDNDVHTWKNGLYFNKLVLNFKRLMDEQEAGEVVEQSGGSSAKWDYINPPGG